MGMSFNGLQMLYITTCAIITQVMDFITLWYGAEVILINIFMIHGKLSVYMPSEISIMIQLMCHRDNTICPLLLHEQQRFVCHILPPMAWFGIARVGFHRVHRV
jgi:hypothetical protein